MKKLLYIALFIFSVQFSHSQTDQPTTVYTCGAGSVSAINRSEYSTSDITFWTNYTSSQYSYLGITIIGNASRRYNCHAYAWHLTAGNTNKVWINNTDYQNPVNGCYPENNNIHKYWTDECFIQVCNEADADKIHYYCGDHSAIKSTVSGKYESKWGGLALVRHNPTSVPYPQPSTVHYYASTKISGEISNLCSGTGIFTVKNISGATYTWTKSSNLSVVGASNTHQYTVQRNGSGSGAAWVEVTISTSCSGTSVTKRSNFTVGLSPSPVEYLTIDGVNPASATVCHYNESLLIAFPGIIEQDVWYEWDLPNDWVALQTGTNTATTQDNILPVYPGSGGWIYVKRSNACGNSSLYSVQVNFDPWCGNYYRISPNPASSVITISPDTKTGMTNKRPASANNLNITITVSDVSGNVKKRQQFSNSTGKMQLNVSDLNTGIYYVHIINGAHKETHRLMIGQ